VWLSFVVSDQLSRLSAIVGIDRIRSADLKRRGSSHERACSSRRRDAPGGCFGIRSKMLRKNALAELARGYVADIGESIPGALLDGIASEPRGHTDLEDLYYVREGRNELPGTSASFVLACLPPNRSLNRDHRCSRSTDRRILRKGIRRSPCS